MANLPVREMVLYKHGVGFFVRQGKLEGTSATLTFRADEVNDILKSLAVFDRAGGQVFGVHYQTPMDRAHRLANTSINLSDRHSVTQLFQQIRGRQVILVVEDGKGKNLTYTGRIIGTEYQASESNNVLGKWLVTLLANDGATYIFPLDSIRQYTIKDQQSQQDLTYFLDTSMSEDNRRTVTVRLSDGSHDLVVYYVAPSPTWRVSYRLVAESDEDGSTGKALLQGWGLFDNRLEEDLDNVSVTLVAGQPISFIYDLYESVIPDRPLVKDEARVVQAPVEYAASAKLSKGGGGLLGRIDSGSRRARFVADDAPAQPAAEIPDWLQETSMEDLASSTAISAEGKETGETFQYSVTTPVTVKRGESALVPIISHTVNYERELLYNQAKLAEHPVASLRFDNQTGLTLERGPVTVVEDSDYKGEAIIPFTKDNKNVYVPYAVELGVKVREDYKNWTVLYELSVKGDLLAEQRYNYARTTYTIENSTSKDKVVTVEVPKNPPYELNDTPPPDVDTLNEERWHIRVPAGQTAEFACQKRMTHSSRRRIVTLTLKDLASYMGNRNLDEKLLGELTGILDAMQSVATMKQRITDLRAERNDIYTKQDELRKNMGALGSTGKEGTLRQRVVDQLEQAQDRVEEIDRTVDELNQNIESTEKQIQVMIQALGA